MADKDKDIDMKEDKPVRDDEIDTLIDMLDGKMTPTTKEEDARIYAEESKEGGDQLLSSHSPTSGDHYMLNQEEIKATLDRYKIAAFKGNDSNLEGIVKDLRLTIDRVDRGVLPKELDKIFPTFIRIWSERKFYKVEIYSQALINGFFQYWMYKRAKNQHLTKENMKALGQILSDDSSFYSLQHTSKNMEDMSKENDEVKRSNPILYTHVDDFAETTRTVYSPFYLDNVNSFCKLDGFSELIQLLHESKQKASLEFMREILDICISLKNYLKAEYKFQFFTGVVDQILVIFKEYSNEDLKSISQEDLEKFINCLEYLLEDVYTDKIVSDEIMQKFELDLALRFLHTPYIEKRVNGLNILIAKVNLVNRANFPCTWKRKAFYNKKTTWLTPEYYLQWLLDHDIFGIFFGETLHSELVVKYYAVLSFLYSKDQLNEKHLELIWDCAINKHDAYRVNILKVLSTLALKIKPSHAKFLYDKVKSMDLSEYCKFTLQLLKHLNKNVCKGPVSDQAAHEAGFGKEHKTYDTKRYSNFDDLLGLKRVGRSDSLGGGKNKARSFSLGGEEKENSPTQKKRHNSPIASLRHKRDFDPDIKVGPFEVSRVPVDKSVRFAPLLDKKEETKDEEMKESSAVPKVEGDKQSTDEEDKIMTKKRSFKRQKRDDAGSDEFRLIKERLQKGFTKSNKEESKQQEEAEAEDQKQAEIELTPKEKAIKEELKEESIELMWKLCQESTVVQGVNFLVHKGAIDNFATALHYNTSEVKWRYIGKMMERLQQNESIISVCSILKKFLQLMPEGDINKIRNPPTEENADDLGFPKTRIEMITKLDKDYALMNELMSLNIEFKRSTLDLIYDHLGRNVDREQSLETQSSLSSANDAEGEDTEEEEVQTDAASRPSQQLSNNGNDENEDNDENDIEMKSGSKPQALSEDDGFIVPKKREVRNTMLSGRNSNNEDEEQKDNKRGANQSLSITDISMTDEDNKEKDLERRYISKRSHSVSHRDPRNRNAIPESPIQNYRENDFILNVETNSVYEMKYFKEVGERLEFIKYILKNGDEIIKPIHLKILWECHIESSFHEKERAIFFEWCTSIIKIQAGYANTRKESVTVFDDDTIELIFFESLLCLDFSTLPEEAYDCFEEYFVYINAQFGQLIRGSFSGSYEVFETKLIGIQALWEIVLQAKDQKVHQKASKFLMTLYKKLSPDLFNNLNTIKEEFLKTCMSHIKDGVKALKEGVSTDDKENGKNRVARSLDQICKFIDEFEGLKGRSKKTAADSAPKITVKFSNQMGLDYQPKKGEVQMSKMTTIKDLKSKLCEAITPHPQDYELTLIYKGKDLSSHDLKTLTDHKYEEGGNIVITKRTFFEDYYTDDYGFGQAEVNEKELETHMETIRAFGIECEDEVIKLALKKNQLKIEETILMLTSDALENLRKEVADLEEQNAFVPIITKEEKEEDKRNEEAEKEEESKLNLILSNKSEYFDLLFDLLNLGVNEINIQAWNLLTQIPVNKKLYSNIKKLDIVKKEDWNALMDPLNMYKLLYSLQIINSLICSPDNDNVDEVELQERYEWRLRFLKQGGFEHLVTILLSQNNIEDSLKMQRRTRGGRKKNKAEDMGKVNYSIHKAGLYMINIIKIFIQASLLATAEDDSLLYSIISQSATSPFMKKTKLNVPFQGSNLNLGSLSIDVSDGSKDNSSHNTPNFASPKSTNTPPPLLDAAFAFTEGDYEVIGFNKNNKKPTRAKNNTSI